MFAGRQEKKSLTQSAVEEYDDLYEEIYDDVSLSTVTVGPNVTEYEVGCMQMSSTSSPRYSSPF